MGNSLLGHLKTLFKQRKGLRPHIRVWERIGENLKLKSSVKNNQLTLTGPIGSLKFFISETKRKVEATEKILLKDMAETKTIPVTLIALEHRPVPYRMRIEFGGDEKWTPKHINSHPFIYRLGKLHIWTNKEINLNKFRAHLEKSIISLSRSSKYIFKGFSIEVENSRIRYTEDYIIDEEIRILNIIDLLQQLSKLILEETKVSSKIELTN